MRRHSETAYRVTVSADREHFHQTRALVNFLSRQHGLDRSEADVVEMAVLEACHNVLRHGGTKMDRTRCKLEIVIDGGAIRAVVTSKGEPFEFDSIEAFNIHQDFMRYKDGGLGIPLIKALMDDVQYERLSNSTNKLTLVKYFQPIFKDGGKRRREN